MNSPPAAIPVRCVLYCPTTQIDIRFNTMIKYQIKLVSQKNSIFIVVILLTLFIGGAMLFKGSNKQFPTIMVVLSLMAISYFLWQKFVTGKTEWTIDKDGVYMTWVRQFYFNNKQDINLKWNEIESISRGFDPNYYTLKIKLVSGKKIRLYHDTLTTKDDFKEFIKTLNQTFNDRKGNLQ
jgi:hypothetical protein